MRRRPPPELAAGLLSLLRGRAGPVSLAGLEETLADAGLEGLAWSLTPPGTPGRHRLEGPWRSGVLKGLEAQRTLDDVLEALSGAGIEAIGFKGAALVREGRYQDAGARAVSDVDVLVRPEAADAAVVALGAAGFRTWSVWSPRRVDWTDSVVLERVGGAWSTPVDLHWRTEYGGLRFGAGSSPLWQGADPARAVPAPGPHLLVTLEHVLKHLRRRPHLRGLADAVRLAPSVDWDRFAHLAGGRPLRAAVAALLDGLARDLGVEVPHGVVARVAGPRGPHPRLARDLRPERLVVSPVRASAVSGLVLRARMAGSIRGGMAELAATALPSRAWLVARYGPGAPMALRARWIREGLGWLAGRESPLED